VLNGDDFGADTLGLQDQFKTAHNDKATNAKEENGFVFILSFLDLASASR
jgi:hypothetical protein